MKNKEIKLRKLGFEKIYDQQCFHLHKYGYDWYVNFWELEEFQDWQFDIIVEDIKREIEDAELEYLDNLKNSEGYIFAEKEFKKKLKDMYNKHNSDLKQLNTFKLDKTVNQEARLIKEAEVKLLKQLMNEK